MADGLVWRTHPDLRDPLLVAAFEGWNDAGNAASGAADWLITRPDATRFASIDSEEHIDYQSRRPVLALHDGVVADITWPANEYYAVSFPERDIVVLRGVEPNVRWKSFCNAVINVATETGCRMVVTLGALLGDVPHTRRVRITGTATDATLVAELGLTRSRYEGPTGIVGVLHDACQASGVRSASLWAPVPHYVAQPPNPPATLALLQRFGVLAHLHLDLAGLDKLGDAWRLQVDHAISDNDEVKTYVRELEARADAEAASTEGVVIGETDLPTGDQLASELEQYLRGQGDDE